MKESLYWFKYAMHIVRMPIVSSFCNDSINVKKINHGIVVTMTSKIFTELVNCNSWLGSDAKISKDWLYKEHCSDLNSKLFRLVCTRLLGLESDWHLAGVKRKSIKVPAASTQFPPPDRTLVYCTEIESVLRFILKLVLKARMHFPQTNTPQSRALKRSALKAMKIFIAF